MKKKLIRQRTNLLTLLILAFSGLFTLNLSAQIVLGTGNLSTKTISCGSSQSFTDDGSTDGLYQDDAARKDSIIICPSTSGRQIKVSFTKFDIASGDNLLVYEGDISKNPTTSYRSASGVGASNAFGGWVQADCAPSTNPTGCLTFVLETNGDNGKGIGWEANVTCEGSGVTVQCPSNISVSDDCNNLDGMITVTIPKPTFTTCGGSANAMVTITSSCSAITGGTVLADGGNLGTFTIPLGSYSITATSIADNSKKCTYYVVADQPTISCNDNVTSSIGFGCTARISVDDILENPCVGSGTTYKISINLGSKSGTKSATVDGSSLSTLNASGLDISSSDFNCGAEYPVEITRIVSFTSCGGGTSLSTSCTGRIKFVDNTAPSIFVTAPTLTTCGNLTDAEIKKQLTITVTDNCDVKDTIVSIGAFPSNFCSSNLSVPVTIIAIDFCGNSNSETFNVKIIRPTTFFAPKDTALTCGSGTNPSATGYPVLDTDADGKGDLPIIENTCNFIPIYTDQVVTATNSKTTKIFRTWQITDWCNQAGPITLPVQVIEVKDTGKPSINCPSGNQKGTKNNPYSVNANSNNCTGTVNLTPPSATDDCGGSVTVFLDLAVDLSDKSTYNNVTNLPIGEYYAIYFGRDETGNRSDTCKIYFNVKDANAPQAICVDELNVSFVNNLATIKVADVDGGSSDNCGSVSKSIRKEGGTWGQTVSLTCEDVNNGGKVYLRVVDSNGGENTCSVIITGKDSTVPECGELSDQTLACEDFHIDNFGTSTDTNENKDFDDTEYIALSGALQTAYNEAFGNPDCSDNLTCGSASIEQEYQLVAAGCGETKIKRRYRATDNASNQSSWKEQFITLTTNKDFSVTFPADWTGNCGEDFPEATLNLAAGGCSILAWTHHDKRFEGENDACYFIERTYSVTNWCNHTAGETPLVITRTTNEHNFSDGKTVTQTTAGNVGVFEYVQILKVTDNVAPIITVANTDECLISTSCEAQKSFSVSANDCLGTESLSYSYELLENGTVIGNGNTANFAATVSNKTYQVKWTVSDNCGNSAIETVEYTFKDCTKPSPFCLNGVITVVDNSGKASVWARDINQKSKDNCSVEENLALRIYHPSLGIDRPDNEADAATILALPSNLELSCDELGPQAVDLYVIDEAGNWDYCSGSVFLQDGSGSCGGGLIDPAVVAKVSGGILSTANEPLAGVKVSAKGTELFEQSFTTNESGIFELDLPRGIGYTISFAKEDDPANGLTTFDILLVSKHILGITPFENLWQNMAADMNKSGSVTAFDMVQMRQIILGISEGEYADNPWRYLPVGGEFLYISGQNDISLTEGILISNLTADLTTLDFIAVKMGDLNGSVRIGEFAKAEERNNNKPLAFNFKDQYIKGGETVNLPISAANLEDIQSLQFGLKFDGLTLLEVENGKGQGQHIAQNNNNEVVISWDKYSATKNEQPNLFNLKFVAKKSGYLSKIIQLSNSIITEAVNEQEEFAKVTLHFEPIIAKDFKLYQNTPNPFTENTTIGFDLTRKSEVLLEIFNLQGALLTQIRGTFEQGYHELPIQKSTIAGNGVLLYQLTTPTGIASKKMILLD